VDNQPKVIRPELLDELLQGSNGSEDLLEYEGILNQLTKVLVVRCLNAEMEHHLVQKQLAEDLDTPHNRRNSQIKKP
jgi:transposase-like protein